MTEVDARLIELVTQQVLMALGERAGVGGPAGYGAASGLRGVGEFASKANPMVANPSKKAGKVAVARPAPAKIFVTADMLRQRMLKVNGGILELAHNEVLTPNAADLADRKHLTVNRLSKASDAEKSRQGEGERGRGGERIGGAPAIIADMPARIPNSGLRGSTASSPPSDGMAFGAMAPSLVGLVVDRADDKVRAILAAMENQTLGWVGVACVGPVKFDEADCTIRNLLAMCEAVAGGKVRAGVALVPYAADAMVLANKVKGVRAVQGTRAASVAAGVRRFGANVLVLEHSFLTFHEMRSMIQAFVAGQTQGTGNKIVDAMRRLDDG